MVNATITWIDGKIKGSLVLTTSKGYTNPRLEVPNSLAVAHPLIYNVREAEALYRKWTKNRKRLKLETKEKNRTERI